MTHDDNGDEAINRDLVVASSVNAKMPSRRPQLHLWMNTTMLRNRMVCPKSARQVRVDEEAVASSEALPGKDRKER
eukprot:scaffold388_cov244-Pinguiococcus_pyrenoidosus.AAC.40